MSELPTISIVTPSFNQGRFLGKTIQSVISQDYKNIEYIILDNCSTDSSHKVLDKYRAKISKVIIAHDKGQADAIRNGFSMTLGEICCYLNSDDYLLPGTISLVVKFFNENPDVDVIYGHRIFVDEFENVLKYWILPPHSDYLISRWDFIPQETCFWRRKLMDEVGGINPNLKFAMDYDLFVKMMKKGKFVRLNCFLSVFRVHQNSKTQQINDTIGYEEVVQVRLNHNIVMKSIDRVIGSFLSRAIQFISFLYKLFAPKSPKLKS